MKSDSYRFFLFILATLLLLSIGACTQTPTTLPFPNPIVPPVEEIDQANQKWQNGNNLHYFVTVEETNQNGTFVYRIVVADGQIRAAQQLEKVDGVLQSPVAIDFEDAQMYTVDALFERVRNDALGLGVVPMNMSVIFDPLSGFPSVVEAKALPTSTEDGTLKLNRELSYSFTTDVKVLIEDTVGLSKDPLLVFYRSGGEKAWCDVLRVYADGTSIYSDDCRQTLLQLQPPPNSVVVLKELATNLSGIDETRQDGGVIQRLVLYGNGNGTPDAGALETAWNLGLGLSELLSRPIGAGITLMYTQNDLLLGFDMRTSLGQPASVEIKSPLHGMAAHPNGDLLTYNDNAGLHWLKLKTGETGLFFSNPPGSYYAPRSWSRQGPLLLERIHEGNNPPEWGWTSIEEPSWHPIALKAEAFTCDTGVSQDPNTGNFVVAAGGDCQNDPGLTLVNLEDGGIRKLVDSQGIAKSGAFTPSWSPDGNWIAFSLALMDTSENPQRLFLVHPDGTEMTALTANTTGQASHPVWSEDGSRLFYALTGADTGEDGIYTYDMSGQHELLHAGTGIYPISVSPSDEFLAFWNGEGLNAILLTHGELFVAALSTETSTPVFVGWLDARIDR